MANHLLAESITILQETFETLDQKANDENDVNLAIIVSFGKANLENLLDYMAYLETELKDERNNNE